MRLSGLALLVILSAGIPARAEDADLLKFRTGDQLHGTILGAESGTGLRWGRTGVLKPILFDFTNLAEVQLAPRPPHTARVLHHFVVRLTNGDQLAGDIVGMDDNTLTLDTWYAGRLAIKRSMVQRLESHAALAAPIYAGPTGMDDWKAGNGMNSWAFKQGALYSHVGMYGTIGREVGLPDKASIEFDVAWRGQAFWNVVIYASDIVNLQGTSGYMLGCGGNNIYINRMDGGGNSRTVNGGMQQWNERNTKTKSHVTIRVDKAKKLIVVYVDKLLVKQWTDPEEFAGKGTGLGFISQGQADLRLSNILVTEWDGHLDTDTHTASATSADDLLSLSNGDKVSGAAHTIQNGELALTTSFADVKIPVARIGSIDFAGKKAERARRQLLDMRAYLPDESHLTVALEKLNDASLAGASENCGHVTIPFDALTKLQFNIYEKALPTGDDDDWGSGSGSAGDE